MLESKSEAPQQPKDNEWDLGNRGKNADQKVKYKHKNHWLEDDMDEIVPI